MKDWMKKHIKLVMILGLILCVFVAWCMSKASWFAVLGKPFWIATYGVQIAFWIISIVVMLKKRKGKEPSGRVQMLLSVWMGIVLILYVLQIAHLF